MANVFAVERVRLVENNSDNNSCGCYIIINNNGYLRDALRIIAINIIIIVMQITDFEKRG